MSGGNEDDKATVIIDLQALKKMKEEQEEEFANLASELEFSVTGIRHNESQLADSENSEAFALKFLEQRAASATEEKKKFPVILFDYESDFFQKTKHQLPSGYDYKVVTTLAELNTCLRSRDFQIVVFNYDSHPTTVNKLSAQIKQKFRTAKTLIMARAISPEKARVHASTAYGASGYCQFPVEAEKVEEEFKKIYQQNKKAS
jgi:PleD family two-component response regulator